MIRKKNAFFTFLCSLFPGAGEMYLGFMKEGISLMGLLCAILMCTACFQIDNLIFFTPLLWFYSFFNVHNKASLPDEEFYALEDRYLFYLDYLVPDVKRGLTTNQTIFLGWMMVLLGIAILWTPSIQLVLNVLGQYLSDGLYQIVREFLYDLPKIFIALSLIYCGGKLIFSEKKQLEDNQDEN